MPLHTLAMLIVAWIAFPQVAHAAADPGLGSVIIQALLAIGILVLVFGRRMHAHIAAIADKEAAKADAAPGGDNDGPEIRD